MSGPFYIADMRQAWAKGPYITFWKPENAGYAWPLVWSGKYDAATVAEGGDYYTTHEDGRLIRFAVPCAAVDAMAVPPAPRMIDGDAGPVIPNTAKFRSKLRKLAFLPAKGGAA